MRTCCWDIESSDLDAHWGRLILADAKPLGKRVREFPNFRMLSHIGAGRSKDVKVLVEIRDFLEQFDVVVSYYGGPWRFDLPMLNSRLLVYRKKPLSPKFHVDLYPVVKRCLGLKKGHRRLSDVANLLGLSKKVPMDPNDWNLVTMEGSRAAMRRIRSRCYWDCVILEEAYLLLLPFVQIVRRV